MKIYYRFPFNKPLKQFIIFKFILKRIQNIPPTARFLCHKSDRNHVAENNQMKWKNQLDNLFPDLQMYIFGRDPLIFLSAIFYR